MEAFSFIVCVLVAVGAAFIVAEEYVFKWLRNIAIHIGFEPLVTFVHCPVCLSWWFGLGVGLFAVGFSWWALALPFASALAARIVKMLES